VIKEGTYAIIFCMNTINSAENSCELKEKLSASLDAIFDELLDELKNIVTIKSVSSMPEYKDEMVRSAENVARLAKAVGFDDVEIIQEKCSDGITLGAPAVIAKRVVSPDLPTVVLYAHHDVQPAKNEENWKSAPFEPIIEGDLLLGRGAADDGAGLVAHYGALKIINSLGDELPVNVTLFIEGEEEIGSPSMDQILAKHGDKIEGDVLVLADSGNWDVGVPAITQTLRGSTAVSIELSLAKQSMHSGMFSGPIMDPSMAMCRLFATLHDEKGNLTIEGLTVDPEPEVDYTEKAFRRDAELLEGIELIGEGSISSRLWEKPSATLTAFDATSTEKVSNTIAASTKAVVSIRFAPSQDIKKGVELVLKHLEKNIPFGLNYEFEVEKSGSGMIANLTSPIAKAAKEAFAAGFNEDVLEIGMGGSIPFAKEYEDMYPDAVILITGVESPDSHAHADNEQVHISDLYKVVLSEALVLYNIANAASRG
jgi:acetylornithine deacetylase/succinyl-diaminopimelate desuccinylase-like protein